MHWSVLVIALKNLYPYVKYKRVLATNGTARSEHQNITGWSYSLALKRFIFAQQNLRHAHYRFIRAR